MSNQSNSADEAACDLLDRPALVEYGRALEFLTKRTQAVGRRITELRSERDRLWDRVLVLEQEYQRLRTALPALTQVVEELRRRAK